MLPKVDDSAFALHAQVVLPYFDRDELHSCSSLLLAGVATNVEALVTWTLSTG